NPFRFGGEYTNTENGTDYTPARLYHPKTGRFTTRDPHPTPLNKYQAYAANPIEHTDPTGNIQRRIRHHDPVDDQRQHADQKEATTGTAVAHESAAENPAPLQPSIDQLLTDNRSRMQKKRVESQYEAIAHVRSFLFATEIEANSLHNIYNSIRKQVLENLKNGLKGTCRTDTCAALAAIQSGKIVLPAGKASWSGGTKTLGALELAEMDNIRDVMVFAREKFYATGGRDFMVHMRRPGAHVTPLTFRFDAYGNRTDDAGLARGFLVDPSLGVMIRIAHDASELINFTNSNQGKYAKFSRMALYLAPDIAE
ncbi:RHS repeat-associated core domain-containing protein, partial [Streptomyces sp. NRRL F-2664]|uniref:RHS repeat-associated core domain-containing protein n=1 Tax=Streptomyces sp. NRRL F-2664 TaxID=1463842 RepID=UPI00131CB21E